MDDNHHGAVARNRAIFEKAIERKNKELHDYLEKRGTFKMKMSENGIKAAFIPPKNAVNVLPGAELRQQASDLENALIVNEDVKWIEIPAGALNHMTIDNSDIDTFKEMKDILVATLSKKPFTFIFVACCIIILCNIAVYIAYQAEHKRCDIPVLFNLLMLCSIPIVIYWNNNSGIMRYMNHVNGESSKWYVACCFIVSFVVAVGVETLIFYMEKVPMDLLLWVLALRLWFTGFIVLYSFWKYLNEMNFMKNKCESNLTFKVDRTMNDFETTIEDNTQATQEISRRFPVYRLASSAISKYLISFGVHFIFGCSLYAVYAFDEQNKVYIVITLNCLFEFYAYLFACLLLNDHVDCVEKLFGNANVKLRLRLGHTDINSRFLLSILLPIITYMVKKSN